MFNFKFILSFVGYPHPPAVFSHLFFLQIMFGPDKCGTSNARTHVIFNYPPKGDDEEGGGEGSNLLIKKDVKMQKDQASHLYTLHVKADGTFEVGRSDG